ncbi:unnamed protein product [Allacma fusca]|uniref:Uncharacterized protein n=1 Tax=Allacma fusca TaxID=39272 RepID=A0A8J2JV82_9HEXA|nr:unnamed protein product [Allacma fusca]
MQVESTVWYLKLLLGDDLRHAKLYYDSCWTFDLRRTRINAVKGKQYYTSCGTFSTSVRKDFRVDSAWRC